MDSYPDHHQTIGRSRATRMGSRLSCLGSLRRWYPLSYPWLGPVTRQRGAPVNPGRDPRPVIGQACRGIPMQLIKVGSYI